MKHLFGRCPKIGANLLISCIHIMLNRKLIKMKTKQSKNKTPELTLRASNLMEEILLDKIEQLYTLQVNGVLSVVELTDKLDTVINETCTSLK